jgi:hypothetical protein
MTAEQWAARLRKFADEKKMGARTVTDCIELADAIELALSTRDAEIAELRGLLKELEFAPRCKFCDGRCIICRDWEHTDDCRLAAALEK